MVQRLYKLRRVAFQQSTLGTGGSQTATVVQNTPVGRIAKLLFFGDFDFAERDADGKLVRRRRQVLVREPHGRRPPAVRAAGAADVDRAPFILLLATP